MRKDVYRKGMILAIICLFVGASVIPSISGNIGKIDSYKDTNGIGNINSGCDIKIFYPTDDTFIDHSMPDVLKGLMPVLRLRNDYGSGGRPEWAFDVLTKFDISSIPPDAYIYSAKLKLYYYEWIDNDPTGYILRLYRATSDWDENTATWDTRPSNASQLTAYKIVPSSAGRWLVWDVTDDVKSFVSGQLDNYGWVLKDENYWGYGNIPVMHFRSKEYENIDYHPYLEIEIDNTPPEVYFTCPEYGHIYLRKGKTDLGPFPNLQEKEIVVIIGGIDVNVFAKDDESGIDTIKFYVNNKFKSDGVMIRPNTYEWKWYQWGMSPFILKVEAWDKAGNCNISEMLITFYWDIEI